MASRKTDKHFFFWQADCPASNWHPSEFTWKGIKFKNAEAAMMWGKAILFGDRQVALNILLNQDPKGVKALGRQVKGFNEDLWKKYRLPLAKDFLLAKFTQDQKCKAFLTALEGLKMVEASPYDKLWGIGLKPNDKRADNEANWQGLNLLGEGLDETMVKIIANPDLVYYGEVKTNQIDPDITRNNLLAIMMAERDLKAANGGNVDLVSDEGLAMYQSLLTEAHAPDDRRYTGSRAYTKSIRLEAAYHYMVDGLSREATLEPSTVRMNTVKSLLEKVCTGLEMDVIADQNGVRVFCHQDNAIEIAALGKTIFTRVMYEKTRNESIAHYESEHGVMPDEEIIPFLRPSITNIQKEICISPGVCTPDQAREIINVQNKEMKHPNDVEQSTETTLKCQ